MAPPWEKLYGIWNSIFSRDLSKEAPNPASCSGAGIGRADAVGTAEYLEGGSTFNHTVEIRDLNDFLEVGEHTDRRARYLEYDRLENIPEIESVLSTYSDEATVPDINGRVFLIKTSNQQIKEECEWLFNDLLQIDTADLWSWVRDLCKNGDIFLEMIIDSDHPELGIQKLAELPPETMFRIETVKGRLLEFQQSYTGPDYQAVLSAIKDRLDQADRTVGYVPSSSPLTTTGEVPHDQFNGRNANVVIRFTPEQIIHARIGSKRRGFYPYGISILYAARRIAHLLKLMEDAMVIMRLVRAPERRVFYIDIGTLPPHKGEMVIERIRDKIKKKKIYNRGTGQVDERYNAWAADEDFFIPTRPESNTRIETLPGATGLSEIDDTKYFREKLMVALKMPKTYLFQEDATLTRTSFATQDMRFARTIYRIQKIVANALRQVAMRHLTLKGFPMDDVRSVKIEFTAPSDWMELSRAEILNSRYNLAGSIKGSQLYDDFTILTKILNHTDENAREIIDRLEQQTLRTQEIQAQAQIFAQLATPDQNDQSQSMQQPFEQPAGMPPMGGELPPPQSEMPAGGNVEQGFEGGNAEEQPINVKRPKRERKKRWTDFADLEADEEEIDSTYDK